MFSVTTLTVLYHLYLAPYHPTRTIPRHTHLLLDVGPSSAAALPPLVLRRPSPPPEPEPRPEAFCDPSPPWAVDRSGRARGSFELGSPRAPLGACCSASVGFFGREPRPEGWGRGILMHYRDSTRRLTPCPFLVSPPPPSSPGWSSLSQATNSIPLQKATARQRCLCFTPLLRSQLSFLRPREMSFPAPTLSLRNSGLDAEMLPSPQQQATTTLQGAGGVGDRDMSAEGSRRCHLWGGFPVRGTEGTHYYCSLFVCVY